MRAAPGRRHLDHGLVGFDRQERLIGDDVVALVDQPGDDFSLFETLAEIRQRELARHGVARFSKLASLAGGRGNPRDRGHVLPLEPRQRDDGVVSGDPHTGASKRQQPALGHQGRDLAAKPASARRLVHDHAASGLGDGIQDGILVIRLERGEIDHLGIDALGGQLIGRRERILDHGAPADEGHIAAFAQRRRRHRAAKPRHYPRPRP